MSADIQLDEIRRRARAIGLTDRDLAAKAGISESTFFRWRGGRRQSSPLLPTYRKVLDALERAEAESVPSGTADAAP